MPQMGQSEKPHTEEVRFLETYELFSLLGLQVRSGFMTTGFIYCGRPPTVPTLDLSLKVSCGEALRLGMVSFRDMRIVPWLVVFQN